jgi:PTS system fructose-specific IIC component
MDACRVLTERCLVRFDPRGDDLYGVIHTLADVAVAGGLLPQAGRDEAVQAVLKREQSGSTVMPDGIAFPHGRTEVVSQLAAVLGVFRNGRGLTDPASGAAVWLVALIFVPVEAAGNGHIHFLARLSQRLSKPDVVACLRGSERAQEVLAALCA